MKKIILKIIGMHCGSCAAIIQKALDGKKGIANVNINIANEKGYVEYDETIYSTKKIIGFIKEAGYEAEIFDEKNEKNNTAKKVNRARKIFFFSLVLTLPLVYLAMGEMLALPSLDISEKTNLFSQLAFTIFVMTINFRIYHSGIKAIFRLKPNMDTLIALGTSVSFIYSLVILYLFVSSGDLLTHVYFEGIGMILTFIALGKYLENKTKGATSSAIRKLMKLQASYATLLKNNEEIKIPATDVKINDILVVKAGEKIPTDAVIIEGRTTIDESAITGESMPVEKNIKDEVIGGTINQGGRIVIKALRVGADTMLAQIIKTVEDALSQKAPIQKMVDQVSYYFVPTVILISLISLGIWLLLGQSLSFSLTILVSVLVIACPCALGLATPTAIMMGTGVAANRGILIKNPEVLEKATEVDTVVFDKTGTLTEGKPEVVDISAFNVPEEKLIKIAYSLASHSNHPLSQALVNFAKKKKSPKVELNKIEEFDGRGMKAFCKSHGTRLLLGNEKLLKQENIKIYDEQIETINSFARKGQTPILIAHGENLFGIIGIMDRPREEAKSVVEILKKSGKEVILLTGDKKEVAQTIAKELGIDDFIAEVIPQEKHAHIKDLQKKGKKVVMVGDGINDAPALVQADIGIAIGGGTDIAIEAGDIVLTNTDLQNIPRAIEISNYTFKKIKQNLFWAFIYNTISIPLAAGGLYLTLGILLSPPIAAAAMAFSSVSVVTNSLIMKYRKF